MAVQLNEAGRRRLGLRPASTRSSEQATRHPVVAVAMVLPVAIALLMLFGGWDQLATQTRAVAELIGR
ncbi:hypothetical protein ACIRBX_17500 [Kitasatospora sp. NPDC096147]|uniref:hypothetical protein n=1 Tax=Kitasatospora sp. NPDC096147 TaxID=3364093 RepID=UPI003829C018